MVGRPREFDTDTALDAAMRAFWAKGYEATSLNDLMHATGLHKGSLYQAFGDKHSLFLQALTRYLEDMRRQKTQLLKAAETPLEGLSAVAHGMIDIADDDCACPKGCMAINAMVELAPHDPAVRKVMGDHIARMRGSLEDTVAQAQDAGQISRDLSPQMVTSLMLTFLAGIATTLKGPISKQEAHELLDAQMAAIA